MSQENLAKSVGAENALLSEPVVHKFGGSSLATSKCVRRVVGIIESQCQSNDIVVVSANGKNTDVLLKIVAEAENKSVALDKLAELKSLQRQLIEETLGAEHASKLSQSLANDIDQLSTWVTDESLIAKSNDVLAYGELWSAQLLSAALQAKFEATQHIDAREFLLVGEAPACDLSYDFSRARLLNLLTDKALTVITGFIAKNHSGETVTLGRNGSDYSATIVAQLVNASTVTLWTDVDGIYSADPRVVPTAKKIHRLPNDVAKALGQLGNPVLHANTLKPLAGENIHLHVRSSYQPEKQASEVGEFGQIAQQELCVTSLNNLVSIESTRYQQLALCPGITIVCQCDRTQLLVVKSEEFSTLEAFALQNEITFTHAPSAMLASVGYQVSDRGEVKANFRRTVRQFHTGQVTYLVQPHALIALLDQEVSVEILNNLHRKLTKESKNIGLVVAGVGNIGKRFLEMLPTQIDRLSQCDHLHLVGLVGSTSALIDTDGIDPQHAIVEYQKNAVAYDEEQLFDWLIHHPYDELILVDITPSEDFSLLYHEFFKHGIHVIGANKWAASSSSENVDSLNQAAKKSGSYWYGNTTVGAGLPINYAIDDLCQSGDEIQEISGIFSGTLSWLFQKFDGELPFSSLVKDALSLGLTEPDPREDLSGKDVQRKLLILARSAGFSLDLADIDCQNLVPEALRNCSKEAFLERINEIDVDFDTLLNKAENENLALRYIASFEYKHEKIKATVKLACLPKTHAFANLSPCDNIFQLTTSWYQENPLIIRGPGAGRDVTAGGIHSDLAKLCQQLVLTTKQAKLKGVN